MVDLDGGTHLGLGKLVNSLPYQSETIEFIDYLCLPPKIGPGSPSKEQVTKWLLCQGAAGHQALGLHER